ncbi:hypothetical protein [Vibrio furnissii]|nr:hypothetical protein [Vibrio furnissii]
MKTARFVVRVIYNFTQATIFQSITFIHHTNPLNQSIKPIR